MVCCGKPGSWRFGQRVDLLRRDDAPVDAQFFDSCTGTVHGVGAAPMPELPPGVEVRRSKRRLRTVTAYRDGDRTIVLIPARFTRVQEEEWVGRMIARLSAQARRRRPADVELVDRAAELSDRY